MFLKKIANTKNFIKYYLISNCKVCKTDFNISINEFLLIKMLIEIFESNNRSKNFCQQLKQ